MQKFFEATGENRDAAIANALRQLGLDRDDVSVEVLDNGKKGFLGIGATPARVRVTYEAPEIIEEKQPAPKAEKPAPKPVKTEPKAEKPAVKPQKLSITDEDDTPRLVKAAPADFVPEKLEVERPRRERSDRPRRERSDRPRRERRPREERPITPSVPKERELIPVSEDCMKKAEELATSFISGLMEKMGIEGQVTVLPQTECDQLRLELSGPDKGPIIGRRGDTLDALQYLVSLQVNKNREGYMRVSLDTENYRAKREEALTRLAQRMAARARKTGRKVTLEPMNPYERRILHSALQADPYVTTHSEGEEPYRRVVITLKGYED